MLSSTVRVFLPPVLASISVSSGCAPGSSLSFAPLSSSCGPSGGSPASLLYRVRLVRSRTPDPAQFLSTSQALPLSLSRHSTSGSSSLPSIRSVTRSATQACIIRPGDVTEVVGFDERWRQVREYGSERVDSIRSCVPGMLHMCSAEVAPEC